MLSLLFTLACSEYDLVSHDPPVEPAVTTTQGTDPVTSPPDDPPTEDDPPITQDCTDVEVGIAHEVGTDPTCWLPFEVAADPWQTRMEWNWDALAGGEMASVWVTPVVADMTGDGEMEVAFTACEWQDNSFGSCLPMEQWGDVNVVNYIGSLVILDGDDGTVLFEQRGYDVMAPLGVADLDGDGAAEVLVTGEDGHIEGLRPDGSVVFRTDSQVHWAGGGSGGCTAIADLDADGAAEVVSTNATWNLDGTFEAVAFNETIDYAHWRGCAVADIDRDGKQEWIFADQVLEHDGQLQTSLDMPPSSQREAAWMLPVQADEDDLAELARVGLGSLTLFDDDGTLLHETAIGDTDRAGPPCLGDFDGDGTSEIGAPLGTTFSMLELDGTVRWTNTVDDWSGIAGCIGFDFDADAALEVVYADHDTLYVFDGRTGAVRVQDGGRASGTGTDTPVIADLDGDGSAELLVVNNDNAKFEGWRGIAVLGHPEELWPPAGPVWSGNEFSVTNLSADGSVPATPEPSWLELGVYRARPAADPLSDVRLEHVDACATACTAGAPAWLSVQVINDGPLTVDAVPIRLFRLDGDLQTELASAVVGPLKPGEAATGTLFEVTADDLGDALIARIDHDDVLAECDEDDNEVVWTSPCPP